MDRTWILGSLLWMPLVWPSVGGLENLSGDYTGYGSLVRVRRKAADSTQLWPDGAVPYTFLEPEPLRSIVMSGLLHWETHTCVRFSPVNNTDFPHLQFRRLAGCRSGVGIEGTSGQNISIGDNCNKLGIVVHEIGHALGFYHEIRRPDRDDHVVINEKNILKDELFNFYKLHWLDISIKYDLSSVMHYNPLEWSSNERTTVATKDPMLQGIIGRWKQGSDLGLSHRDKLLANTIYGCLDRWLKKCNLNRNPCKNEGYLGESCTCICAPGTRGRTCGTIIGDYYDDLKSPCSREVTYPTSITSPNYPNHYDADTWCVYRLKGQECQAPEVVITDFQLGPRSFRDQCFHDYLEVRNETLYNGFIKCGTDVTRGTRWIASSSTMILYFKGSEGGHRGFKARVEFNPIPGCCRTHTNSSSHFFHTPGYPHPYAQDFNCSYGLQPKTPAKVVVTVRRKTGSTTDDQWTCALRLCQPHGRCRRHCSGTSGSSTTFDNEVVLPNVASVHYMQYSDDYSPFKKENAAYQVGFTLEDSPCHRIIIVNRTEPRGRISVGPRFFELLQCEWWIQAPRGSHVKVTVLDLQLPVHEDSYLAINEAGEATYPKETTRVYHNFEDNPKTFVSLEYKLAIVLQGDFVTEVSLKYELYDCIDLDGECEYWSADGECEKNPHWMDKNCMKSCVLCEYSASCQDEHRECEFWAAHDQCDENSLWMAVHCKMSCGYCDKCWDANPQCQEWADIGECEGNPSYMDHYCKKSCGLCGDFETTTATEISTERSISRTSTTKSPFKVSTNKTVDAKRVSKHRTVNQTFKPYKTKFKRYRKKHSKLNKDRLNHYKHNNVLLPPDTGDKEARRYKNQKGKLLHKGENLKKPFSTGRLPRNFKKQKKSPDVLRNPLAPRPYRTRASSPNTRIGTPRNRKRKQKKKEISVSPRTDFKSKIAPQEDENLNNLIALPLVREAEEPQLNTSLGNTSLPSDLLLNSTRTVDSKETPEGEVDAGIYLKENITSSTVCKNDSCTESQAVEQKVVNESMSSSRKLPKPKPLNLTPKRKRKCGKMNATKRERKQHKKRRRQKKKILSRKLTLTDSSRNSTDRHSTDRNSTRRRNWRKSRRRAKQSRIQRNRRKDKRKRGKGPCKRRNRGSMKRNERKRRVGSSTIHKRRPGKIVQTSTPPTDGLTLRTIDSFLTTTTPRPISMLDQPKAGISTVIETTTQPTLSTTNELTDGYYTTTDSTITTESDEQDLEASTNSASTKSPSDQDADVIELTTPITTDVVEHPTLTTTAAVHVVELTIPTTTAAVHIVEHPTPTTTAPVHVVEHPIPTTAAVHVVELTIPTTTAAAHVVEHPSLTTTAAVHVVEHSTPTTISIPEVVSTTANADEIAEPKDSTNKNQESNVITDDIPASITTLERRIKSNLTDHLHSKKKMSHKQRRRQRNHKHRLWKKNRRGKTKRKPFLPRYMRGSHRKSHKRVRSHQSRIKQPRFMGRHRHKPRSRDRHSQLLLHAQKATGSHRADSSAYSKHGIRLPERGSGIPSTRRHDLSRKIPTTASPPAPSSTSNIPSPEDMMVMKTSETQTEISPSLHTMMQTEPKEESLSLEELGDDSLYTIKEPVVLEKSPKMQLEEPKDEQQAIPPQRSPEKYAEWGIGPLKSPHDATRRERPKWKYRRSFYRRDHIYEDIWPIVDRRLYGRKR